MAKHREAGERLEGLLAYPTRLAVIIALASSSNGLTPSQLEKLLGIPRQTIHTHLEMLAREGIVTRQPAIRGRPTTVYQLNPKTIPQLIEALRRALEALAAPNSE